MDRENAEALHIHRRTCHLFHIIIPEKKNLPRQHIPSTGAVKHFCFHPIYYVYTLNTYSSCFIFLDIFDLKNMVLLSLTKHCSIPIASVKVLKRWSQRVEVYKVPSHSWSNPSWKARVQRSDQNREQWMKPARGLPWWLFSGIWLGMKCYPGM